MGAVIRTGEPPLAKRGIMTTSPRGLTSEALSRSLSRQARILQASIVLTPVDNISLQPPSAVSPGFLRGLYASDKRRNDAQKKTSSIQFSGRDRITYDINQIHDEFARRLNAEAASLRLLSGLHAQVTVFMALAAVGDTVLLLPEAAGGHFATKGILERLGLNVVEMAVDFDRLCVDQQSTLDLVAMHRPDIILVDRSEGLKYEDFSWLKAVGGIKVFDASQYLPQIMHGLYPNPFDWGFDLLIFSLHKSFPGPQKAGAAARSATSAVWRRYLDGVSAYVSSSHIENSYAAGYALAEWDRLTEYAERLEPIAERLEEALAARGAPVVRRMAQGASTWPGTHHLWMRFSDQDHAYAAWRSLARVRIQTNYRKLPYGLGWGLRLGSTAAVMRGLTIETIDPLADLIVAALREIPHLGLRLEVRRLAERMARDAIGEWR